VLHWTLVSSLALAGCDDSPALRDAGSDADAGAAEPDAGAPQDAGPARDAGPSCVSPRVAVCARGEEGFLCGLSDGVGSFEAPTRWTSGFGDVDWAGDDAYWGTLQLADVNGDGADDLCGRNAEGVHCALATRTGDFGGTTLWLEALRDGSGFGADPSYWATLQLGDVDGDGDDDLCARLADGLHCARSNGVDGFEALSRWSDRFSDANLWTDPLAWPSIQLADADGDGDADACARTRVGIVCDPSNGSDAFDRGDGVTLATGGTDFANDAGWAATMAFVGTIRFPDLDGDGDADVCGRDGDGIFCALSDGSGFGEGRHWLTGFFTDADGYDEAPALWGSIQFPDVDGDGAADVCGRRPDGLVCARSNGADAFEDARRWTDRFGDGDGWGSPIYWSTLQFPDLDGDGDADVCARGARALICLRSNGVDAFESPSGWTEALTDEAGFDEPSRYRTLRYPVAFPGDCADYTNGSAAVPWITSGVPPRLPTAEPAP
jgi:hypothetical protein